MTEKPSKIYTSYRNKRYKKKKEEKKNTNGLF